MPNKNQKIDALLGLEHNNLHTSKTGKNVTERTTEWISFTFNSTQRTTRGETISIHDLLPRDALKFLKSDTLDVKLNIARQLILEYKLWTERYLPAIFDVGRRQYQIPSQFIKKGQYSIKIRISQNENNPFNVGLLLTHQAKNMIGRFLRLAIIERCKDNVWGKHYYDTHDHKRGYAKGYILNIQRLFAFLSAIDEHILLPIKRDHGICAEEAIMGNYDFSKIDMVYLAPKLNTFHKILNDSFGEDWFVRCCVDKKAINKRPDWNLIQRETGLNIGQCRALEEHCYSNGTALLKEIKKGNYAHFSKAFVAFLQMISVMEKRLRKFNKDKGYDTDKINPHSLHVKRTYRGKANNPMLGGINLRIANDLCSKPKENGLYKDFHYNDRIEVFKEKLCAEELYSYDTKNSIHNDNVLLIKGEHIEGDLYSDVLPPVLRAELLKDKEWCQMVKKEILKDTKMSMGDIFLNLFDRAVIKRLCNVVFSNNGSSGRVFNYLYQRFPTGLEKNSRLMSIAKRYAETLVASYKTVTADFNVGGHIFFVESYRMLFVAERIIKEKGHAGLIYDCLITDKKLTEQRWKKLNKQAIDEMKKIGYDFYDVLMRTIKY